MRTNEFEKVARIFFLGLGPGETAKSCSRAVCLKLKSQYQRYFQDPHASAQGEPSDAQPTAADLVRLCTPLLEQHWSKAHHDMDWLDDLLSDQLGLWINTSNTSGPSKASDSSKAVTRSIPELQPWYRYLRAAPMDEAIAVLYSAFLNISDEVIAESLQTTLGTVRYRLGRAHRQMGALLGEIQSEKGDS